MSCAERQDAPPFSAGIGHELNLLPYRAAGRLVDASMSVWRKILDAGKNKEVERLL